MNERIKELLRGFPTDATGNCMCVADVEQFAELIVRECADVVFCCADSIDGENAGDMIVNHFGVKP
jgi:hypothetical protein